jgi:hypothetical protein
MPEGTTDLATATLDALTDDPDVVVIVSDGYENVHHGDLARVAATLPQVGVRTPVVFCHSMFTNMDDLALRRPAPALPELVFWHQDDFEDLLVSTMARAAGAHGRRDLRTFLLDKLERHERRLRPWIATT